MLLKISGGRIKGGLCGQMDIDSKTVHGLVVWGVYNSVEEISFEILKWAGKQCFFSDITKKTAGLEVRIVSYLFIEVEQNFLYQMKWYCTF